MADLIANLQAAIAQIQDDIAAVPSISGATVDELNQLGTDTALAFSYAEQANDAYDDMTTFSGNPGYFAAGLPTESLIINALTLQTVSLAGANAFNTMNSLGRLAKNVAAVTD